MDLRDRLVVVSCRRRLPLQDHWHGALRSCVVRIPQQAPEAIVTGSSPEGSANTTFIVLRLPQQNPAEEREACSGVRCIRCRHEAGRVEGSRLSVNVQQRGGPITRQRSVVGSGAESGGGVVNLDYTMLAWLGRSAENMTLTRQVGCGRDTFWLAVTQQSRTCELSTSIDNPTEVSVQTICIDERQARDVLTISVERAHGSLVSAGKSEAGYEGIEDEGDRRLHIAGCWDGFNWKRSQATICNMIYTTTP